MPQNDRPASKIGQWLETAADNIRDMTAALLTRDKGFQDSRWVERLDEYTSLIFESAFQRHLTDKGLNTTNSMSHAFDGERDQFAASINKQADILAGGISAHLEAEFAIDPNDKDFKLLADQAAVLNVLERGAPTTLTPEALQADPRTALQTPIPKDADHDFLSRIDAAAQQAQSGLSENMAEGFGPDELFAICQLKARELEANWRLADMHYAETTTAAAPEPEPEAERFEPYDWHEGDYLPSERERADMLDTLRSQDPDASIQAVMQEEYDEFHYTPVEGPVSEAMHILWHSNIHGEQFPETFREAVATLAPGAEIETAPEPPQPAEAKLFAVLYPDNETYSPPLPAEQAVALHVTNDNGLIVERDGTSNQFSEMGNDRIGLYAEDGGFQVSGVDYIDVAEKLTASGYMKSSPQTPQTAEERLAAREAAYQAERNEQPSQDVERSSNVIPFERD